MYETEKTLFLVCLGGLGALVTYLGRHIEEAPITGRRFIWVSNEGLEVTSTNKFYGVMKNQTQCLSHHTKHINWSKKLCYLHPTSIRRHRTLTGDCLWHLMKKIMQ